jgi:drug/metabolite transporter (DMT)-like permease
MDGKSRLSSRIESLSSESKTRAGLGLVLASSVFFSLSNVFVKHLTEELSTFTIIFGRGTVGLLIILFCARFNIKKLMGENRKVLLLRGIFGTLALAGFFFSVKITSLSNSVSLFSTFPIFATIFGTLFFREPWKNIYIPALICSFGGIWLIVRPELGSFGAGEMFGIAGALSASLVINIVRYLRKSESVFSIIFYFTVCTTVFSIYPAGVHTAGMSFPLLAGLLLVGIFTTLGQLLMTAGYTYCTATGGSIMSLLGLPITLLLSRIFLAEGLDIYLGAGAFLIFVSGYLVAFSKGKPFRSDNR